MIRDFLFLPRVKRQLVDGTLPSSQTFVYFFITEVDNLQLGLLQVSPARPTLWTPLAVWGSLAVGSLFLVGTYLLNEGSAGRDYLIRYFSISAVVALWVALPLIESEGYSHDEASRRRSRRRRSCRTRPR